MGLLDRWVKRFLTDDTSRRQDEGPGADDDDDGERTDAQGQGQGHGSGRAPPAADPLDKNLVRARARLTADERGRAYAESPEFDAELAALDAGGRTRAADALLADALLVNPSTTLRRLLAERLLHRGERARAKTLLERLKDDPAHQTFAYTALGELAEQDGDVVLALTCYEQVLAFDMGAQQVKTRARRLRQGRDEQRRTADDSRNMVARFLGARAAGARYAVLEEIGRGGAATVFRARDRVIGREVALKIFHPRGKAADRRARLLEEAKVAGSFDHPHIVPILDIEEGRDLLVMALCDGGSLRQRLTNTGRLRVQDAIELGAVLLRTLGDIHAAGHAHLDVKPSNLLFHQGQPMLCDFGTAGMKEMGAFAGTRAYMAPEQKATGRAEPPADLYAAGLVVVECIEGALPASSKVELKTMSPGPRRRALEGVLSTLLGKEPAERPQNGGEAAQALLEAAALPADDKEGTALFHHLEMLAHREGDLALTRLRAHPLVSALRP